jgi:N-methylhydantoinase A
MRYFGQNYEHEVEIRGGEIDDAALEAAFQSFGALHAERYGYLIEGEVIELVSFRVTAIGKRPQVEVMAPDAEHTSERRSRDVFMRGLGFVAARVVHRRALRPGEVLEGPALIEEEGSTTFVEPGMQVEASPQGSLIVTTGVAE